MDDILTLGRTSKVTPSPWYKGGGGWNPSPGFFLCFNISERFCIKLKAFDVLYKMMYILWVAMLLGASDVIQDGSQHGCHLGFYQHLEIITKWRKLKIFMFVMQNMI